MAVTRIDGVENEHIRTTAKVEIEMKQDGLDLNGLGV